MSQAAAFGAPALTTAYAVSKRALNASGVLGAWLVGVPTGAASHRLAVHLYFFFFSSTRITRIGEGLKAQIEGEFKKGGYRNLAQVLSNAGVGSLLSIMYIIAAGRYSRERAMVLERVPRSVTTAVPTAPQTTVQLESQQRYLVKLTAAHLCLYAAMNGDTWASELGVLSPTLPRLITTLATVPAGTNGGVSLYGLVASAGGGFALGLAAFVYDVAVLGYRRSTVGVIAQATAAGLVGSVVDSVLGATLQYSGALTHVVNGVRSVKVVNEPVAGATRIAGHHLLTNNQVNMLSGLLMAVAGFYTVDLFYPTVVTRQPEAPAPDTRPAEPSIIV